MVFSEYYREIEPEKCQPEESQNEYPIPSMKNQTSTSFASGFSCVSQPSIYCYNLQKSKFSFSIYE